MNRRSVIMRNDISELRTFNLGGFKQKVLIEGLRRDLPVVICLHGGPGTPIPFSVGCRGMFPEFTDNFIMVYWDQLGCGANDRIISDDYNIKSYVQMTEDLIDEIKSLFPSNKIILLGLSWGTVLCARLLKRNPHAVDAVVACGQIVSAPFISEEVMFELATSKMPKDKLTEVLNLNADNFSPEKLKKMIGAIRKYTNGYQHKEGSKASLGKIILGLLTSPDYKFKDFKAIIVNGMAENTYIWKELLKINLSQVIERVDIPYRILQGDSDIVASTRTIKGVVNGSHNSNLKLRIVDKTGHIPGVEMMDALLDELKAVYSFLKLRKVG